MTTFSLDSAIPEGETTNQRKIIMSLCLAIILARLGASGKALLVLGAALCVVGAVFTWMWLQERKVTRVYRKDHPHPKPPPSDAPPQRTPGLSLAEERRRRDQEQPPS